jgi:hypothetical protein
MATFTSLLDEDTDECIYTNLTPTTLSETAMLLQSASETLDDEVSFENFVLCTANIHQIQQSNISMSRNILENRNVQSDCPPNTPEHIDSDSETLSEIQRDNSTVGNTPQMPNVQSTRASVNNTPITQRDGVSVNTQDSDSETFGGFQSDNNGAANTSEMRNLQSDCSSVNTQDINTDSDTFSGF